MWSAHSCTHIMCGCVCTYIKMWNNAEEEIFYIHSCRKKVGRQRKRVGHNIWHSFHIQFLLSLSLFERRTTHLHTHVDAHLWAAAASRPHFPVDVLFQLKLWLIGFLHGPVLQFPDRDRKDTYHIQPIAGAIATMILIGLSNSTC